MVGTEFDWVAVDRLGQLGIFSTAGYGSIPPGSSDCSEDHAALLEWFIDYAALPKWADLLTYEGDLPAFVYDWEPNTGPYRRAQSPRATRPTTLGDIPGRFRELVHRLDVSFDLSEAIEAATIENQGEHGEGGKASPATS